MMRILILVVAGGAALMAAMLVRGMGSQPEPQVVDVTEAEVAPAVPLSQVLVSSSDMPIGYRISPDDLVWQDWPEELLTDNFFQAETSPDAKSELAGSIVRTPIYSGEPVLAQKIVNRGENGILAAVINEGMRGVAVEISVETAAGGFILPNDRVDVILTYEVEVTENGTVVERPATQTVLQNVRVLAIDQTISEVEGESVVLGTTATLELTPRHSEILMLATRMGDISLTLRGVADAQMSGTNVLASNEIKSARDVSGTVRIYRNGNTEQTNIGGTP
ncbi:MAG: Flp pilus assembly protein CpaB [Ponticaulis sp.]|nr:Flp pilus assembly protein CpaB [Ponticaulis sp.]